MPQQKTHMQQAMKMQHIRNAHEHRHENSFLHADNKVERTIVNFTKIPEILLEGLLTGNIESITGPKNYTDLNDPETKKRLESNIDSQDNKETTLADIRRQLNFMRDEESNARKSLAKETQERQQAIAHEEREKEEEERRRNQQTPIMPTPKQKRGVMGQKRKKSIETNAATGKQ